MQIALSLQARGDDARWKSHNCVMTDSAAWFEFNSGYFSSRKVGTELNSKKTALSIIIVFIVVAMVDQKNKELCGTHDTIWNCCQNLFNMLDIYTVQCSC